MYIHMYLNCTLIKVASDYNSKSNEIDTVQYLPYRIALKIVYKDCICMKMLHLSSSCIKRTTIMNDVSR